MDSHLKFTTVFLDEKAIVDLSHVKPLSATDIKTLLIKLNDISKKVNEISVKGLNNQLLALADLLGVIDLFTNDQTTSIENYNCAS